MSAESPNPTNVATLAGVSKFQQSKQILTHVLHRIVAIFFMRVLCLGDLLPLALAVAVLAVTAFGGCDAQPLAKGVSDV